MTSFISLALPYAVLFSHLVLVFLVLSLIFRNSWGREVVDFVAQHAIVLSFLAVLAAVAGSLFYSNIIGFAPCELCWWQRIFLYPQVVILFIALRHKDIHIFKYVGSLSLFAFVTALYQVYVQSGGVSVLPCTATGSACAKIFVDAFGYITIPVMSLTVCVYLLFFAAAHKLSKRV